MSDLPGAFRDRLRTAIAHDPRTMREISRISGYDEAYIRRLCNGERCNPTLAFVEVMSKTLNCDPAWMLGMKEKNDA